MLLRFTVARRCILHGEVLEPGEVVIFEVGDKSASVSRRLPCSDGSLLDILSDGAITPLDCAPDVAGRHLGLLPPQEPRVLPLRPRRLREA
jgi:hypothetical protein